MSVDITLWNPPKAALSPYNIFLMAERNRIVQEKIAGVYRPNSEARPRVSHEEIQQVIHEYHSRSGRRPHRRTQGGVLVPFQELSRAVSMRWAVLNHRCKQTVKLYARFLRTAHQEQQRVFARLLQEETEAEARQNNQEDRNDDDDQQPPNVFSMFGVGQNEQEPPQEVSSSFSLGACAPQRPAQPRPPMSFEHPGGIPMSAMISSVIFQDALRQGIDLREEPAYPTLMLGRDLLEEAPAHGPWDDLFD